jgi:undecaprenyl diphosphate synthase
MVISTEEISKYPLPVHIAMIMDGNGRWAKRQGKNRVFGHHQGVKTVRKIVEYSVELNIKYLSLYTFSTENWNRPKEEVDALMNLLVETLKEQEADLMRQNIKLNAIGNLEALPPKTYETLLEVLQLTDNNTGMVLSIALNYGGRNEIVEMTKKLAKKVKNNIILPENIDENKINLHLYTHNIPDVDFMIRTGGEKRISNFLLWKIAYAELYFTDVLWPDFNKQHYYEAIADYQKRERRFGKTSEQINNEHKKH